MKAIFNDKVIAESDDIVELEGKVYFPANSVFSNYLQKSNLKTICPWKGTASYYNVIVEKEVKKDAAFYYPIPMDAALKIKDHIAFHSEVQVVEE